MKIKNNTVTVHEKFTPVGIRTLDTKKRVSLGDSVKKNLKIDSYEVLIGQHGDVLLRPLTHIPARERWIYENPEVLRSIKKGFKEAKEGKLTKVNNVEKFLEDL